MNLPLGFRFVSACLACVALLSTCALGPVQGQDETPERLEPAGFKSVDGLKMVTSVEVSQDGKFLYASAWQVATINVFQRDAESGELTEVQTLADPAKLQGATAVRLSPDGRLAVASAFGSKTAVLFRRDPMTGKLTELDVAQNGVNGVSGLDWAIDAAFSPDSKFVYVLDSRGPSQALGVSAGSVTAFRITDQDKLEFVEAGSDSDFSNARGLAISPDGKRIVVVSSDSGTLAVLSRHAKTGKTTIQQVIRDEQDGVHGLDGAMAVTISPDGRFIYVSSGRFRGDHAIGVYQFDEEGSVSLVQEFINGEGVLKGFRGGNEITVSPDGRNVYAVASRSSSLACFRRDSENGQLKFLETIPNEEERLKAAAGICLSPDGEFVYVAAEQSGRVSFFRRKIKQE